MASPRCHRTTDEAEDISSMIESEKQINFSPMAHSTAVVTSIVLGRIIYYKIIMIILFLLLKQSTYYCSSFPRLNFTKWFIRIFFSSRVIDCYQVHTKVNIRKYVIRMKTLTLRNLVLEFVGLFE